MGDAKHVCKCAPQAVEKYMGRISGPMLDRIDLHIEVPAVPFNELSANADGTSSKVMRENVNKARDAQADRFKTRSMVNSRMGAKQIRQFCPLESDGRELLKTAMEELGLSARAHDRILRVARTIADLGGSEKIKAEHVGEAIGYRSLDRRLWVK